MRSSVELPPLRDHFKHENFSPRPRELLPSILARSPPPRSSTLPPIQRRDRFSRPRKSSITQNARKPKHESSSSRPQSRDYPPPPHHHHHHYHPTHRRPSLGERKALSAEPQTAAWAQGKRWEDLIEAATSATEVDDDRSVDVIFLSPPPSPAPCYTGLEKAMLMVLGRPITAFNRQYHLRTIRPTPEPKPRIAPPNPPPPIA